ncbi:hypothetical protein AYI69_g3689 [Smittium culicis]|uniref:Uncharacterized protein n=1 Tax=Smittium culicis TaxID=133412 RepID=A0A1R1YIZ8_9FUNG|nr:hypothetical protein AYI69_g3689 [Smittium culicis]
MEQIAETQAPARQDQVKALTELVQQLLRENERNQEPEDPSMNYSPPPLNDSASSAVKKADTALYGIQVALAQATRPIDYFVHRRILENPGLDTSEDPEVVFVSTMRALLSDVAATPAVHDPREDRGSPTSPRPPQAQPSRGGSEFQYGDADLHLPYDPQKRMSHVAGSAGCFYAHSGEGPIDVDCSSSWVTFASPSLGAQEQSAVHVEVMDIDGNSDEASNPEPAVLEEQTGVMEWAVILARNTRARDLYRIQKHSMGNCCGYLLLLWSLEHTTDEDAHQCKRATEGTLCSEAQKGHWQIGVSLLRQHNHTLVHQEVRMHNLLRTIGDLKMDLVTLPENQNPPPINIRTITSEPSGCSEQTDDTDRIVYISEDIRRPEYAIRSTRFRPVCVPPEQEAEPPKMVRAQQPKLLPALESDIPGYSKISPRTNHNDAGYTNVEVSNLVPSSEDTVNISADQNPSNDCSLGSQKRKISALGKQALELDDLEDQRRFLERQGLGIYAVDFKMSNKRRVRRRLR